MLLFFFFVAEHDGSGNERLVLDTRHVNERFLPATPPNCRFQEVWQGLKTVVGSSLNIG